MVYNVNDNRIKLGDWFFELDTQNNLHVYAKGMEYFDMVSIGYECISSIFFNSFEVILRPSLDPTKSSLYFESATLAL